MADTPADLRSHSVSAAPGTSGPLVLGPVAAGYFAMEAADDGKSFSLGIKEGSARELRSGCVYTHSTGTFTRGTLVRSTSGNAINFTANATVSVVRTAAQDAALNYAACVNVTTSSPSTSAAAFNMDAIQAGLTAAKNAGGGVVRLSGQGVASMSGQLIVSQRTTLVIDPGLRLSNYQNLIGGNLPMVVNENWQSPTFAVSGGITDAATVPALAGLRIATADCGTNAHGLSVGQGVEIKGDTSERYLGIWEVAQVIDQYRFAFFVPAPAAIGASTGSVTAQRADLDITVTGGGMLDYRGGYNRSSYGYNAMAMVFNKVRNLQVHHLTLRDAPKYGIYWGNLQDATFSDLYIEGPSAAIQGIGLGLNVSVERVKGQTNDDFLAWTGDNAGYPEFNIPNGSLTGQLRGFNVRDVTSHRTHANMVGLYPTAGADSISGVVIDGLHALTAPGRYVYIDGDSSITTAGVGDVAVRNLSGVAPTDSVIKVGGVIGGMTMRRLHCSDFDLGSANVTVPLLATGNNITISKIDAAPRMRSNYDSTGTQRYVFQLADASNFPDVTIEQVSVNNAAGGSGTYLISGNFSGRNVNVRACEFYGTAAVKTGNPAVTFVVENCYFDSFRAVDVTANMTLFFRNNRFNTPSGPCLLAYGSSFTANLHIHGNYWGTATAWLQIGAAAGDTLICNLWQGGNRSAPGYGTGINFTSSSSGNYLRQSDASLPMDCAKWTGIDAGCQMQNTNAAFGGGAGILTKGPTTIGRVA